jgi:hypothetical protein
MIVLGQIIALLPERVTSVDIPALLYYLRNDSLKDSPRQLSQFAPLATTDMGIGGSLQGRREKVSLTSGTLEPPDAWPFPIDPHHCR